MTTLANFLLVIHQHLSQWPQNDRKKQLKLQLIKETISWVLPDTQQFPQAHANSFLTDSIVYSEKSLIFWCKQIFYKNVRDSTASQEWLQMQVDKAAAYPVCVF